MEFILCAAIWRDTGKQEMHQPETPTGTGLVFCGHRHCAIIVQLAKAMPGRDRGQVEQQGFLTSTNRWVGRVEARTIAIKAGQLQHTLIAGRLFSEDLY